MTHHRGELIELVLAHQNTLKENSWINRHVKPVGAFRVVWLFPKDKILCIE